MLKLFREEVWIESDDDSDERMLSFFEVSILEFESCRKIFALRRGVSLKTRIPVALRVNFFESGMKARTRLPSSREA